MNTQEALDTFYWKNGPCCAGCDHWRHMNAFIGECQKSPPVAGKERVEMIGIQGTTLPIGAGHVMTPRGHECGSFKDEFDWASLPLAYQARVGAR